MSALRGLSLIFATYLIGSFPTAFVMGKVIRGEDIRKHGSGNVGATNAIRVLGAGPGLITLLIDFLKGYVVVGFLAPAICVDGGNIPFFKILACVAVIAGHNWMVFLSFKGGKGVATTAGAFLALTPLVTVCALVVWGIAVLLTRYVSLGSMLSGISLAVFMTVFNQPPVYRWFAILIAAAIILKHHGNIKRLIAGTERRLGSRGNAPDGEERYG